MAYQSFCMCVHVHMSSFFPVEATIMCSIWVRRSGVTLFGLAFPVRSPVDVLSKSSPLSLKCQLFLLPTHT